MAATPCPADNDLFPLIGGGDVAEALRRHVDGCGACRGRVERLRAEVSAVREAASKRPLSGHAGDPQATTPRSQTRSWPSSTAAPGATPEHSEPTDLAARPESIGRYRIVGELDSGGQGAVYRAVHPTLPRDLAIKIAHEPSTIDRSLLKTDAAILCELDHPNLVRMPEG
jgi:hypothetical protein